MSDSGMKNGQSSAKPPASVRSGGPFGGGHGMGRPVEKAKNFKATLKRLLTYLKPHKVNLVIVIIFAVASTTFMIASPKIIGRAMNKLKDGFVARSVLRKMTDMQKQLTEMIAQGRSAQQQQLTPAMPGPAPDLSDSKPCSTA